MPETMIGIAIEDARLSGTPLPAFELIEGGVRIKTSDDGRHYIDVLLMAYNWRLAATDVSCPLSIDRAWCYRGNGPSSFVTAVMAALAWDGSDDTEPAGYFKRAF